VSGPVPCKDGYVALTISRAQFWRDAMTVLGLDDLARDERYSQGWYRRQQRDYYSALVDERLRDWDRWDLFEALAARLTPPAACRIVDGADHSWVGYEADLRDGAGLFLRWHLL